MSPLVTQLASASSRPAPANGYGSGSLTDYTIGTDGVIIGSFNNGRTAALGQIALANFANVQGLERVGNNEFSTTLASGAAIVGAPGTGGSGNGFGRFAGVVERRYCHPVLGADCRPARL